jgi:hypothetical protein
MILAALLPISFLDPAAERIIIFRGTSHLSSRALDAKLGTPLYQDFWRCLIFLCPNAACIPHILVLALELCFEVP